MKSAFRLSSPWGETIAAEAKFMPKFVRRFCAALAQVLLTAPMFPALAEETKGALSDSTFAYLVVGGVAVVTIVGLGTMRSALSGATWSLSDALSEEADISPLDADGKPLYGPDGKPQVISELRASSSRLIALIGLISILAMYTGFGLVALKDFASTNSLPSPEQFNEINGFLFAGVTMFAPYIANKFSSIFDWLKPTK
jgi:hypothetical protein